MEPDTCTVCGIYDVPIEILNGKAFCEECADEISDRLYGGKA